MLNSLFREGSSHLDDTQSDILQARGLPNQSRINAEDSYELLHTILYYIYTDRIAFGTNLEASLPPPFPKLCSAEDVYMAADRMLLSELKYRALEFLKLSCTTGNIVTRVLSKFAELHEEVSESYAGYFRKHWDLVKGTENFSQCFSGDDELDEVLRINSRFRELMKGAVFL